MLSFNSIAIPIHRNVAHFRYIVIRFYSYVCFCNLLGIITAFISRRALYIALDSTWIATSGRSTLNYLLRGGGFSGHIQLLVLCMPRSHIVHFLIAIETLVHIKVDLFFLLLLLLLLLPRFHLYLKQLSVFLLQSSR